jgi:tRNA A-37 threonylcarbamoyl transferase component Bud32
MRLLVVAARSDHRMLVKKHAEIEWPDVMFIEHRLGKDPVFEPQFAAAGFDAVIIVSDAPTAQCEQLAIELKSRAEFAPIVLILLEDPPQTAGAPEQGLFRLYGRKIDREQLVKAIEAASLEHRQSLSMLRANPAYERRYRFGSTLIRGHRCLRQVGSGGMCTIYLAESERAGNVVVLKVFSQVPDVSERIASFDRFLREYEIVAGLNHKNIVQIYDLGVADDHAYIAMEHFPAGDLRQRMKSPLSQATALNYLEQIASALYAIHSVGILHRDMKPANVMLRADGSLCLIDFGLAKANAADPELTGKREIFGTPYYMSPEQGHAEEIDARSDLYSLGVMFYEMLIGRKPFNGSTAMEVIYKHKRAELPEIAPQFAAYEDMLRRMLAKSPADRFQSAAELLQAVSALKLPA